MSTVRPAWLVCDVGEDCEPSGDGSIGESMSVGEARRNARMQGWHRTRDGRDICPDCWAEGRR